MKRIYIYNKVKGLAAAMILAPLSSLLFTSCGDFLEIEPQDKIVLEKFWNEKSDVENVLVGCYSALQSYDAIARMMVWGEFRSDNVEPGLNTQNNASLLRVLNENIDATNGFTTWNIFYAVINRCNTVMLYAPDVAAKDPAYTQSELNATIAEATALRALCYFYLIRTFRDVPYITEAYTDDSQEMEIAATPFNRVLNSLIADLESVKNDAVRRYPSNKALYQTGRITQQAIYAMLCEMYLWKQDYDNCIKYAELIIDAKKEYYKEKYAGRTLDTDGRLNGYPLEIGWRGGNSVVFGLDYGYIFGQTNSRVDIGDSDEIIFELVFMSDQNMLKNGPINDFYGNATDLKGMAAPASFLGLDPNVKDQLFNKLDARYYFNISSGGSKNYRINKYVYENVTVEVSGSDPRITYYNPYNKDYNSSNWIVYRLTDIMLLEAEALVERGEDESEDFKKAFELVQTINNRALCDPKLTNALKESTYIKKKSMMRELVLKERQRELMFEGKRWYDLVRRSMRDGDTDMLTQCVGQKDVENSALAQNFLKKMDAIFWPYNQDEVRVNSKLVQNPAFGSGESNFTNN